METKTLFSFSFKMIWINLKQKGKAQITDGVNSKDYVL